jgi:hypothetical protein
LPEERLAAIRTQIIQQVRLSLDESRGALTMWRGQRFAANHNWAHHSARGFAALALWGDSDSALQSGELQSWLDDALEDFWIVKQTHASDGAPLEGPTYQDYALRFYVDFIVQTETLLQMRESFFDDHLRALSARLFTLLPGATKSMVYADGYPDQWWGACSHFYRLAAHFQDGRLQRMGEVMAQCGDPNAGPTWRDFFGYDPDLVPTPLEALPLVHDMTDFGLYTARSSWDADAAFFGLRCGTASASSVVERFGYDFPEAHLYPSQGDFSFYIWSRPVIPGCEYAKTKLTRNHNLVVFAGRSTQTGNEVGQLGEGGTWFNAKASLDPDSDYARRARPARVISALHGANFHSYLCDLGGLYRLRDERVEGEVFFPEYFRRLIFLPAGAIAIVDHVRLPVPRSFAFRLLTVAEDLSNDPEGFHFSVGGVPARMDDYSPEQFPRFVRHEELATREPSFRHVALLQANDRTEAIFAIVLGIGPAVARYQLQLDQVGCSLSDRMGGNLLRFDWKQPERLLPRTIIV